MSGAEYGNQGGMQKRNGGTENRPAPVAKSETMAKVDRLYAQRERLQHSLRLATRQCRRQAQRLARMRSQLDCLDGNLLEIDDLLSSLPDR